MNQSFLSGPFRAAFLVFFTLIVGTIFNPSMGQAPVNDICANAIPIVLNAGWVASSNAGTVVNGPNLPCGGGQMVKDVWYSFVYPGGNVSILTQLGSLTDTRIGVSSGCGAAAFICNDDFTGIGFASRIDLTCSQLTAGQTYYIQAGGYEGQTGNFSVQVTSTAVAGCTNPTATNYEPCATVDNGSCTYDPLEAVFSYAQSTSCSSLEVAFTNASSGNIISHSWSMPGGSPSSSTSANPQTTYSSAGIYNVTLTVATAGGAQSSTSQNIVIGDLLNFEVAITADNFPNETSWKVFDSNGNETATGNATGGTTCMVADECYSFVIYDSYGDGICCAYGTGAYSLFLEGNLIGSGGEFGASEATSVNCPAGSDCNNNIDVALGVHTAPFAESWFLFVPEENGQYKLTTCDLGTCNTIIWMYDYCNMANFDDSNAATLTYNDGFCGDQAQVTPVLEAGTNYYVRIRWAEDPLAPCDKDFLIEYLGPIAGCTNPLACNYDPLADISGPCYFNDDPECSNLGPDLSIRGDVFLSSMYNSAINVTDACSVGEGCVQGFGNRQVVRFTTYIDNIGNQDYYIGSPSQGTGQFEWDPCHNHYHYEGYAEYVLFDPNGFEMPQIGFKNGFCVLDLACPNGGMAKYTCGNMGITAGCADYYGASLQCQWVDITDVPAGTYTLVMRVNWDQSPDANNRYELRYDNNWAAVCISFGRDANNNVINFTKSLDCAIPIDCLGQPYGSAIPDCEGNCPGVIVTGDLDQSDELDNADVQLYLDQILDNADSATPCTDINSDEAITVMDAALVTDCIIHGTEHIDEFGVHNHCVFDINIINPEHTVTLSIGSLNTTEGYFDVYLLNPDCKVVGYEFNISGATIASVENLVNPDVFNVMPQSLVGGSKVIGLSLLNEQIQKNYSPTPLLRIHYQSLNGASVCISEVVDIVNEDYHGVVKVVGPCVPVTQTSFADFAATPTTICFGGAVQFTDLSTNGTNGWSWNFTGGSPSFSTVQNPVVTYNTPGMYTVSLTASNGTGTDTKTLVNYIDVLANGPSCADCNGNSGGSAYTDGCGTCVGGSTGLQPCDPCNVAGGVLSSTSARQNLCIGDGVPNLLHLHITGNVGAGAFGLARQSDGQIIVTNTSGNFNMENYPAVSYLAGHISVPNLGALQGITHVNQLSGCYSLSNFLPVTTVLLSGGTITALNGTTACGDDGIPSPLSFAVTGANGPAYRWAVLTQNGSTVLASNTTGTFNFDQFGPGNYKVVRAVFSGVNPSTINPLSLPPCVQKSNIINVNITGCAPSMLVEPNPTSGINTVSFTAKEEARYTLEVYDMQGRSVQTIFDQITEQGLPYRVIFDGTFLPNGVYIYRLTTGSAVEVAKFMIAR